MKNDEKVIVSEHVLEVRHQPTGRFLDVRGYVADHIKGAELFPHWNIDTNIIRFSDSPKSVEKVGAFAGYRSAGVFVYDPDTRNFFEDKASKFWKVLKDNQFYTLPEITRFGCRSKIFLNSDKSFEEINKTVYSKFFTEDFKNLIGEKEKDLQVVIEISLDGFELKFKIGPIHKEEANLYFNFESKHFSETGLFIDIDVYKSENIQVSQIPKLTKSAIKLTWEKVDNLAKGVEI